MVWKSCCKSSQSRRQSPSGPGGGGCMAAAPRAARAVSRGRAANPAAPSAAAPPPPPPSASGLAPPPPIRKSLAAGARWLRPQPEPIRTKSGTGRGHVRPGHPACMAVPRLRPARRPSQPRQSRGTASNVPTRRAGSKPKPREVTPALSAFDLGKLRISGEKTPSLSSSCNSQPRPYWSPASQPTPAVPHTATRLPFVRHNVNVIPWPCL